MSRTNLNNECNNLKLIIDNLKTGKESCRIEDSNRSLDDVIDYLNGYLQELNNLNDQIVENGNTSEMLQEVHDKYTELWLFQLSYYIDSLPIVIGGLLYYPNEEE